MDTMETTPGSVVEMASPSPAKRVRRKKAAGSEPKPANEAPDERVNASFDLFGIDDPDIAQEISRALLSMERGSSSGKEALESGTLIVRGLRPQTMAEGLLAVQMAAIHRAMMKHSRALALSETTNDIQLAQGGLNKLARTFAIQAETLQRLRDGSTQTIRVERVTVNEGGQAIVGVVGGRK